MHLKDEAVDFLEQDTVRTLIKKYSQFINFPIYLWASKTVEVEEAVEEDEKPISESEDDEAQVCVYFFLSISLFKFFVLYYY